MEDFVTLKFLDLFRGAFERGGIDYKVMRRILHTKLLMDGRRVPTILSQSRKKKKKKDSEDANYFIRSLWIYAFMGLILIPFILFGENYIFQMTVAFAIIMFITMTSMISDFSSVLLDIRDQNILHTKPVNPRTITAAKTFHICIYLFFLTGSLLAIPLVVGLLVHGVIFFFVFLVGIILTDLLILFLTALLYFLILRFFDGEKLKDVINYVQIGLAIGVFVGYQVVVRAFDVVNFHVVFPPAWWHYLIPPIWYAAPFELLLNGHDSPRYLVLSLLALILPLAAIFIYTWLMPAFERNLQKLAEQGGPEKKKRYRKRIVARLICANQEERTFFRFAGYMMNKEREFKLKVYPSLGFSIVIPFIFLFNKVQSDSFAGLASSKWYLSIYGCMFVIPTVLLMLNYSGAYKGAWIFKTASVQDPTYLYRGTLKAALFRLFLPVYGIIGVIFLILFGWQVLPHLVAALLGAFLYALICFKGTVRGIPFSQPFSDVQQGGVWSLLPFLLLIGVFILAHLMCTFLSYGIYLYLVILLLLNGLGWKVIFKTSWENALKS